MTVVALPVMSEGQARDLLRELDDLGLGYWVIGGWGIDALLGQHTRAHHDLDLLVDACGLPGLQTWLREQGFARCYEWAENLQMTIDGHVWDTAFVEGHADGRELDVHAIHVEGGLAHLATTDPWELPQDILSGCGSVGGYEVRCATASGQRAMHIGYELPETHKADLRRLQSL